MTVKKSIIGIVLFVIQICIATAFNASVDLKIIMAIGVMTFGYILYKFVTRKYDSV